MKKIFILLGAILFSMSIISCKEKIKYEEYENSAMLNKDIYNWLERYYYEGELALPITLEDYLRISNESKKYLISIDFENEKYVCGYLDKSIKKKIDKEYSSQNSDLKVKLWSGLDDYLIKYCSAIFDEKVDEEKYPIKWFVFDNYDDILDEYNKMSLICITQLVKLNVKDYNDNDKFTKDVCIDINYLSSSNELKVKDGYLFVTRLNLKNIDIFASYLYELISYESFEYKIFNDEVYINSKLDYVYSGFEKNDYKLINNKYYYKFSDVEELSNK